MSVEQSNVIDGIGIEACGSVEMLISDHLEWSDPNHLQLLAAKVESYANAVLSGHLAESYPAAKGKNVRINVVWQHVPNGDAARFFEQIEQQLKAVGIEFSQTALPAQY